MGCNTYCRGRYEKYSGYPGGLRFESLSDVIERYQVLEQKSDECVLKISKLGLIEYVDDKRLSEELGLIEEGKLLHNSHWIDIVYEDDKDEVMADWENMINLGIAMKTEFKILGNYKSPMWVLIDIAPACEESNEMYIGLITDITQEKEILSKLLELKSAGSKWI
jgi:PAS domain-containing protein